MSNYIPLFDMDVATYPRSNENSCILNNKISLNYALRSVNEQLVKIVPVMTNKGQAIIWSNVGHILWYHMT